MTNEYINFLNHEQIAELYKTLISISTKEIIIYDRKINTRLFNNSALIETMKQFLLRSQKTTINFLINSIDSELKTTNKLIHLQQRFNNRLSLQVINNSDNLPAHAFIISDNKHIIFHPLNNFGEISYLINNKQYAKKFKRLFEYNWQNSSPCPSLKVLNI